MLLMLLITFSGYVALVTRNNSNMTIRQRVLKAVYPAFMWMNRIAGKSKGAAAPAVKTPVVDFYSLKPVLNSGDTLDLSSLKGKKILLVNTASDCGYTDQYSDLQKLYEQENGQLVILAFPANDFKEQEKGSDEAIASFCKKNYGITFPLMKKSVVSRSAGQHPVFAWLSDAAQNGWNNQAPSWNFCKYLVNKEGALTHFFPSSVSPLGKEIKEALAQ